MSRTTAVSSRPLVRFVAALAAAVLAVGTLTILGVGPAAAAGTLGFTDAVTDNSKTWDRPGGVTTPNTLSSLLFSSITVDGTEYVVPQSARNLAPSNGDAKTYADPGLPLATSAAGPVVAYLTAENPGLQYNRFRVFPSGVFGPMIAVDAAYQNAHTTMTFPITLKNTVGTLLGSATVAYKWDSGLAALPFSSVEYLGPRGRFHVGPAQTVPTPLNWPAGIAVSSSSTGSPTSTSVAVTPNTTTNLYVAAVDIAGLALPRYSDAANSLLQLSAAWAPAGAGRPSTTSGAGAWRVLPVNVPAGTYSLNLSGLCDGICEWNANNDLDSYFSSPAITVTSAVPAATRRPDAMVRPAGGLYAGNDIYNTNGLAQTASADVAAGASQTFEIQLQNDGTAQDTFLVAGSPSTGVPGFTHSVSLDAADVTADVDGGNLPIPNVPAAGVRVLTFTVTPALATPVGTTATYYLHMYAGAGLKDVVGVLVTVAAPAPGPGGGGLDCTTERAAATYVAVPNGRIRAYNDMELILPKEAGFTGTAAGGNREAHVCAARNSFAAYQLNVGGTTALTIDSVSVPAALDGPGAATLDAAKVRIYRQQPVTLGVMSNGTLRALVPRDAVTGVCSAKCDFSDVLLPAIDPYTGAARAAFPVTVPATENRSIWVDIEVPAGQVPGEYTGNVVVRVDGVDHAVGITLTVLPVTIPSYGSEDARALGSDLVSEFRVAKQIAGDMAWFAKMARAGLDDRISVWPDSPDWYSDARWATVAPLLQGTDPGTRLPGASLDTAVMVGIYTTADQLLWIKGKLESIGQLDKLAFWCDEAVYATSCAAKLAQLRQTWPGLPLIAIPALNSVASDPHTNGPYGDVAGATGVRAFVPEITRIDPHPQKKVVNAYWKNFGNGADLNDYTSRADTFRQWAADGAGREFWTYVSCMSDGCTSAYGAVQHTDIGYSGWPSYAIDATGPAQAAIGWQAYLQGFTGEHHWAVDQCRTQTGAALTSCLYTPGGSGGGSNGEAALFFHSAQFAFGGTDIPVESLRLKRIRDGRQAYALLRIAAAAGEGAAAEQVARGTGADPVYLEMGVSPDAARYDSAREALFALAGGVPVDPVPPVLPTAPQNVTAIGGDGRADVTWTAPAEPGTGGAVTYTVTAFRDSEDEEGRVLTCTTTALGCTVTGLYNLNEWAEPYTFTVVATSAAGSSPPSAPSNPVRPHLDSGTITGPVPTIFGVPSVGSTLTAIPGVWDPDPVTLSYRWFRNGAAIANAVQPTYKLVAADAGAKITVRVIGSKAGLTAIGRISAPLTIQRYFTKYPVVRLRGTAAVGSTISVKAIGAWAPAPTTREIRWYRDGEAIAGAFGGSYQLTDADAGHVVSAWLTGQRPGYTTRVVKSPGVLIPYRFTTAPTPTIVGPPSLGTVLTAVPGGWDPAPSAYAYQWFRNGSAIKKATASTYKLVAADAGTLITVRVIATRAATTALGRYSTALRIERPFTALPKLTLTWTGSIFDPVKLRITGSFSPAPTAYTATWLRNGEPIAWYDDESYHQGMEYYADYPEQDYGTQLTLRVTASRPGYTTRVVTSAPINIKPIVRWTGSPSVSGTSVVGGLLSTDVGAWSPASPTFSYWWEQEGAPGVAIATTRDYSPTVYDLGQWIRVHVIATAPGHYPAEWRSGWLFVEEP